MKKILLIAYRDFSIRIRNKTFLLTTLLLPIGIIIFYGAIFFFSSNDFESYRFGVVDSSKSFYTKLKSDDHFQFILLDSNAKIQDDNYAESMNLNATIVTPESQEEILEGKIKILSYSKLGLITKGKIESIFQNIIENERFKYLNLNIQLDSIRKPIAIQFSNIQKGGVDNELKETISYGLGFGLGMLMYIILTIYGSQVMRGVMEEKTNRIVEIIISSVRPFELLMGKIIGIAMVSFVQLICWAALVLLINIGLALFIGGSMDMSSIATSKSIPMAADPELLDLIRNIQSINFLPIVFFFIFYFIGGFFLYSSLFASVGSAVGDDPQDVQQLMMPIMLPIFLSFIFLTKAINNPTSTEAVVASLVPFTSPVVMMARIVIGIPEGVPVWQIVLSMAILIASTFLFILLAARIYKVGILLYGKKVGWKEMLKWVVMK